jgi:hypothetical protein
MGQGAVESGAMATGDDTTTGGVSPFCHGFLENLRFDPRS